MSSTIVELFNPWCFVTTLSWEFTQKRPDERLCLGSLRILQWYSFYIKKIKYTKIFLHPQIHTSHIQGKLKLYFLVREFVAKDEKKYVGSNSRRKSRHSYWYRERSDEILEKSNVGIPKPPERRASIKRFEWLAYRFRFSFSKQECCGIIVFIELDHTLLFPRLLVIWFTSAWVGLAYYFQTARENSSSST